jgi:hypothetical protein
MKSQSQTIINLSGEHERVTLPQPEYSASKSGQEDFGTGVWLTGIWRGPRTGRMFVRTYSIWASSRNDGSNVGSRTIEVDESGYLRACDVAGIEPRTEAVEV